MMRASIACLVKFMIFAAAFTPPTCEARSEVFALNLRCMTVSSSRRASGCTVCKVAIRAMTSACWSSGSWPSTSAPRPKSRYEITSAMICGCSSRISSAIERASIQSRISIGRSVLDGVIRLRTDSALSSPRARVITLRM